MQAETVVPNRHYKQASVVVQLISSTLQVSTVVAPDSLIDFKGNSFVAPLQFQFIYILRNHFLLSICFKCYVV